MKRGRPYGAILIRLTTWFSLIFKLPHFQIVTWLPYLFGLHFSAALVQNQVLNSILKFSGEYGKSLSFRRKRDTQYDE